MGTAEESSGYQSVQVPVTGDPSETGGDDEVASVVGKFSLA